LLAYLRVALKGSIAAGRRARPTAIREP
jgi:hypothetical protein